MIYVKTKGKSNITWENKIYKLNIKGLLLGSWVSAVMRALALHHRVIARAFVTEGGGRVGWGIFASAEGRSLGIWGYPSPENFQIWRLRNAFFTISHEICGHYNQNN